MQLWETARHAIGCVDTSELKIKAKFSMDKLTTGTLITCEY